MYNTCVDLHYMWSEHKCIILLITSGSYFITDIVSEYSCYVDSV